MITIIEGGAPRYDITTSHPNQDSRNVRYTFVAPSGAVSTIDSPTEALHKAHGLREMGFDVHINGVRLLAPRFERLRRAWRAIFRPNRRSCSCDH